jgi:hypothetical protein
MSNRGFPLLFCAVPLLLFGHFVATEIAVALAPIVRKVLTSSGGGAGPAAPFRRPMVGPGNDRQCPQCPPQCLFLYVHLPSQPAHEMAPLFRAMWSCESWMSSICLASAAIRLRNPRQPEGWEHRSRISEAHRGGYCTTTVPP